MHQIITKGTVEKNKTKFNLTYKCCKEKSKIEVGEAQTLAKVFIYIKNYG